MDKQVSDFALFVGNSMDAELETYKLGTIQSDPKTKNSRIIFRVKAVDVNVRRAGGFYFVNLVFGRPNIVGRFDLDKVREVTVNELNSFLVKDGKPAVYLCFPDRFEDLPMSVKNNPYWGNACKMVYLQMASKELQEEILRDAGYQTAEIQDILSQSQSKLNEFIMKQLSDYTQVSEASLKSQVKSGDQKPDDNSQGRSMY